MKLYLFSNSGNHISREEIEVIEKLNSYEVPSGKAKKRIPKSTISVLNEGFYSLSMYLLEQNPEKFIKAVLEYKTKEAEKLMEKLEKLRNDAAFIETEFQGYISNNIEGDKYRTRGELFFKHTDDGLVHGTPVANEVNGIEPIFQIYESKDFANALLTNKINETSGEVQTIFVTGKRSNLAVDGTKCNLHNPCIVTKERFKEMTTKTKIEVNFKPA